MFPRLLLLICAVGHIFGLQSIRGQSAGCSLPYACNYDPTAESLDPGSCTFDNCAGCTYPNASNYDANATFDDGSCVLQGCTDEHAANFEPLALADDGSCSDCPEEPLLPEDVNGDGIVNIADLIAVLLSFGDTCEAEEVLGCTDPLCTNFLPEATADDGSCECGPPPLNNSIAEALPLVCGDILEGSNDGIFNADSALTGINELGVWYTMQMDEALMVAVDLCQDYSDLPNPMSDPTLAVYTFNVDSTALELVVSNDDACGLKPFLQWEATANKAYFILVGTWNQSSGGDFRIHSYCTEVTIPELVCIGEETPVELTITTDCWPEETAWTLLLEGQTLLAESPVGLLSGQSQTTVTWGECLPPACYTLSLTDAYGDGLSGASYAECGVDGSMSLVTFYGDTLAVLESPNFGYGVTFDFCVEPIPLYIGNDVNQEGANPPPAENFNKENSLN